MNIKHGLISLGSHLKRHTSDYLPDFLSLEARYSKNENDELILGISENTRNERNQIMRALNALALAQCGISFNELCEGKQPPINAELEQKTWGMTSSMQQIPSSIKKVTLQQSAQIRQGFPTDDITYIFVFSVVDSSYIGTPREQSSRTYHEIRGKISWEVLVNWRFFDGDPISQPLSNEKRKGLHKVLFWYAKEYIEKRLRAGALSDKESFSLTTDTTENRCPFEISAIPDPNQFTFDVDVQQTRNSGDTMSETPTRSLSTILKMSPENKGKPHQPGGGAQWFTRLAVESAQVLHKCKARIHRIRQLDNPDDSSGEPLSEFTPSYLSWAKKQGLFDSITLRPGEEEHLDLVWRAHGDPQIPKNELRVASSLDLGIERKTTSSDWGMRQDFIRLKPGYYLFTVRIYAEGYDDWVEGTYRLYWPGVGQEDAIRLTDISEIQDLKGYASSTNSSKIYHGIGKAWAVLVGVNYYTDPAVANLKVCADDVTAIHQALSGSYEVAKLLTDATSEHLPTRANILGELSTVAQSTGEDDLLLFYFSGHGMARDGESYLLARDTRLSALKHTAVAMKDVREIVEQSPAHAKVIVLDACHAGASIGKAEPTMTPEFIQRVFEQAEGIAVLASCKENQQSWEWPQMQRSVFTYYLLDALTGKADFESKGFVSVSDVSNYVTDGVKMWAAQHSVPQTPTLQYTAAGDIILLRYVH